MISYLFLLLTIGLINAQWEYNQIKFMDDHIPKIEISKMPKIETNPQGPCCYFTDKSIGQIGICCNFGQQCQCGYKTDTIVPDIDCFCLTKPVHK
jgi:hypothetical protein